MDKEIYEAIVERLVDIRKDHHISMTKMARSIGVTRQSIYNFESNHTVSYKLLFKYITHPAFSTEELACIYDLMGG